MRRDTENDADVFVSSAVMHAAIHIHIRIGHKWNQASDSDVGFLVVAGQDVWTESTSSLFCAGPGPARLPLTSCSSRLTDHSARRGHGRRGCRRQGAGGECLPFPVARDVEEAENRMPRSRSLSCVTSAMRTLISTCARAADRASVDDFFDAILVLGRPSRRGANCVLIGDDDHLPNQFRNTAEHLRHRCQADAPVVAATEARPARPLLPVVPCLFGWCRQYRAEAHRRPPPRPPPPPEAPPPPPSPPPPPPPAVRRAAGAGDSLPPLAFDLRAVGRVARSRRSAEQAVKR